MTLRHINFVTHLNFPQEPGPMRKKAPYKYSDSKKLAVLHAVFVSKGTVKGTAKLFGVCHGTAKRWVKGGTAEMQRLRGLGIIPEKPPTIAARRASPDGAPEATTSLGALSKSALGNIGAGNSFVDGFPLKGKFLDSKIEHSQQAGKGVTADMPTATRIDLSLDGTCAADFLASKIEHNQQVRKDLLAGMSIESVIAQAKVLGRQAEALRERLEAEAAPLRAKLLEIDVAVECLGPKPRPVGLRTEDIAEIANRKDPRI